MFLTTNSIVVVSNSQKQSVSDAFQYVVFPPSAAPTFFKMARRELAGAKLLIFYQTKTEETSFLRKRPKFGFALLGRASFDAHQLLE